MLDSLKKDRKNGDILWFGYFKSIVTIFVSSVQKSVVQLAKN